MFENSGFEIRRQLEFDSSATFFLFGLGEVT